MLFLSHMYSDAHCHLHLPELSGQLNVLLQRHPRAHIVCAAASNADWPLLSQWRAAYRDRFPTSTFAYCLGYHPQEARHLNTPEALAAALQSLEQALQSALTSDSTAIAALGEIGLDKILINSLPSAERPAARQAQQSLFEGQLRLAKRYNLPVVIHNVRYHQATLASLRRTPPPAALIHGFYGDVQVLREFCRLPLEFGLYVSPNAQLLERAGTDSGEKRGLMRWRELAKFLPRERFLLETDSCLRQDGTPATTRDTQNLAAIWGEFWDMDAEEVQTLAANNLRNFCAKH